MNKLENSLFINLYYRLVAYPPFDIFINSLFFLSLMKIIFGVAAVVLFVMGVFLYQSTGFMQTGSIDVLDEKNWGLSNGIIPGSQDIELQGNSGTCWILVHGYTSTPDELRELVTTLHSAFI